MQAGPAKLVQLIEPIATGLGYELLGCEMLGGADQGTLRIYIDHEAGITVDDCQKVSRQVSSVFDVEDPIAGEYVLEVSSPGLNRPIFSPEQLARYCGCEVKLRAHRKIDGRKNFTGTLKTVSDDEVSLEIDSELVTLSLDDIDKANLVPEF